MWCKNCGHEDKDVLKKREELCECTSCGYPMEHECNCTTFQLVYDNKTDMCDWHGNDSMYWKDYKEAKARGENVKPQGED